MTEQKQISTGLKVFAIFDIIFGGLNAFGVLIFSILSPFFLKFFSSTQTENILAIAISVLIIYAVLAFLFLMSGINILRHNKLGFKFGNILCWFGMFYSFVILILTFVINFYSNKMIAEYNSVFYNARFSSRFQLMIFIVMAVIAFLSAALVFTYFFFHKRLLKKNKEVLI